MRKERTAFRRGLPIVGGKGGEEKNLGCNFVQHFFTELRQGET